MTVVYFDDSCDSKLNLINMIKWVSSCDMFLNLDFDFVDNLDKAVETMWYWGDVYEDNLFYSFETTPHIADIISAEL